MKNIKIFFYILVILSSSYYVYQHYGVNNRKSIDSNINNHFNQNDSLYNPILNIDRLGKESIILKSYIGDTTNFEDILCENYTICYRCFEASCQSCILNTIWFIKNQLPKLYFVIFASFPSEDLSIFRNVYYSDQNVYNLQDNYLIPELDSSNTPYLLILDRELKVHGSIILHNDLSLKETNYIKKTINNLEHNLVQAQ